MPITPEVYTDCMKELTAVVNQNEYLKNRMQAAKEEQKALDDYNRYMLNDDDAAIPALNPELHDLDNPKTSLFDQIIPMMEQDIFQKMITAVEDGDKAKEYLKLLSDHVKLLWELELPSHKNHGLTKILTPEDYDKLEKNYTRLSEQTEDFIKYFQKQKSGMQEQDHSSVLRLLGQFTRSITRDFAAFKKFSKGKAPVSLSAALKSTQGIRVSGDTVKASSIGAAQSSRKIVSLVRKDGTQVYGLFTPQTLVKNEHDLANDMARIDLGAHIGERMDNRSSAMTRVSELLGRADLLAYAQEMKIDSEITPDNPTGTGTFMETVIGTDRERLLPEDKYFLVNMKDKNQDIYTDQAKTDMMDLSILDYLCGNVDRHDRNIIYKYKKDEHGTTRLDGLKGIDNDDSFPATNLGTNFPENRLGALTETICISEAMAKKLSEMTVESLEAELEAFGLSDIAILEAGHRLQHLQNALNNGKKFQENYLKNDDDWGNFLNDGIGYIGEKLGTYQNRRPCLVVIPAVRLSALKVAPLGNIHTSQNDKNEPINSGVFNVVSSVHTLNAQKETMKTAKANRYKKVLRFDFAPVLKEGAADFNAIAKASTKAASDMLTQCARKTNSVRGTSEEFEAVVTTLRAIENASEQFGQNHRAPENMEINLLSHLYKELENNCDKYLTRKENQTLSGIRHKDYALKRIELIKQIKKQAEVTRTRIRKAWDEELSDLNTHMARAADAIDTLVTDMTPLHDFMMNNKGKNVNEKKLPDVNENKLPDVNAIMYRQQIPMLCKRLQHYSELQAELPELDKAVTGCAELLENAITYFGGDLQCDVSKENRRMLDRCRGVIQEDVYGDDSLEASVESLHIL